MKNGMKSRSNLVREAAECRNDPEKMMIAARLERAEEQVRRLEALIRKRTDELAKAGEALQAEVDERKLAEEAKTKLAAIIDHSEDAIIGKTLDGVVTSWNSAAERMFGYSAKETVGRSIILIFPPDLMYEEQLILRKVRSHGFVENYDSVRRTKDGQQIDVSVTVSPVRDLSGRIIGLTSIKRNVTKRKEIESALTKYMTTLEKRNQELQEFAFIASHDLQEPLRKIRIFGGRLRNRYDEVLDNDGRDYLDRMEKAAERMQRLIDALLNYSRVTTQDSPFESVNLQTLLLDVAADLGSRIEEANGRLEIGDLPVVDADPDQMRQLFSNLIGNALKYRNESKPLIRIFSDGCHEGLCRIFIEDNGIGFDEKYLDRIFMLFQRLHGRGNYEGTGIGLAICKKIVERHKGTITARSIPGSGSTFIVSLPPARYSDADRSQQSQRMAYPDQPSMSA
jgi:PAS domain S-box-containing protein